MNEKNIVDRIQCGLLVLAILFSLVCIWALLATAKNIAILSFVLAVIVFLLYEASKFFRWVLEIVVEAIFDFFFGFLK